jgi:hypothetical protein
VCFCYFCCFILAPCSHVHRNVSAQHVNRRMLYAYIYIYITFVFGESCPPCAYISTSPALCNLPLSVLVYITQKNIPLLINGEFVQSKTDKWIDVHNPVRPFIFFLSSSFCISPLPLPSTIYNECYHTTLTLQPNRLNCKTKTIGHSRSCRTHSDCYYG